MGSDTQQHDCNTGLSLDLLGFTTNPNKKDPNQKPSFPCLKFDHVLPSLSLGPVDRAGLSTSPGSSNSHSNNSTCEKKRSLDQGKEFGGSSYVEEVDEDEEGSPRKKLRLTKEQSAVLEDSFKQHSTLNPNQKEALARRLNLRPRQVEVWFQNRRARIKLKQTEIECEVLKKCCETLTEENKRLKKEVQELKTLKLAAPAVYMQMPAPTLSICPSCERFISTAAVAGVDSGGGAAAVFSSTKPPQLFATHPSAAC